MCAISGLAGLKPTVDAIKFTVDKGVIKNENEEGEGEECEACGS